MKKPTPKTLDQIKAEAEKLKAMKPNVRQRSAFGDDHHAAIDAQLEVMEKGMSEDDIYDKWDSSGDDDIDADEGRCENVLSNALEARRWMDGEEAIGPCENWQSLIIK